MAKRHLRLHEPGWRHGLLINGLGAVTTAVVTVVIAITKFAHGAWAVMVFVPIMVWLLVRMNHRYTKEQAELETGTDAFERGPAEHPIAVILVDDLDRKTMHALQYAKTIRTSSIEALHVDRDPATTDRLRARWAGRVVEVPLRVVERNG